MSDVIDNKSERVLEGLFIRRICQNLTTYYYRKLDLIDEYTANT